MNYRKISRLFAIFYMILSTVLTVGLIIVGLLLAYSVYIVNTNSNSQDLNSKPIYEGSLVAIWIAFVFVAVCCAVNLVADWRLIKATREGTDPKTAVKLCKLWVIISWISLVIGTMSFLFELFVVKDPKIIFSQFSGFILQGVALFCVHKFQWEMRQSIPHTICFTQIDQADVTVAEQNALLYGKDYVVSVKCMQNDPPPPYNPYYR